MVAASERRKRARTHSADCEDFYEIGDDAEEIESIGEDDYIDAVALKRINMGKSQRDDSDDDDAGEEDDEEEEEAGDEGEEEEEAGDDLKRTPRGKRAIDTKASASASKMRVSSDDFVVKVSDWVRMKTGIYKGDIGMAVEVHQGSRQVTVKLVPRINVHKFKTKDFHQKKNKPVLVNRKQLEKLGIPVANRSKDGTHFKSCRMEFEDGYLIKRVAYKKIYVVTPETPKDDELQRFKDPGKFDPEELSDVEEEMPKAAKTIRTRGKKAKTGPQKEINASSFKKLDKVKVVEGTHKGCIGRVRKVNGNAVFVASENLGILRIHKDQLERCYELADHVRIASGIHQDQTGEIVYLGDDSVLVHCEKTKSDVNVSKDCLGEVLTPSEIKAEKLNERDLVLINQPTSTFGMIIEIDTISNTLKILKGDGDLQEVMEMQPKDVKKKLPDEHAKGIDASSRHVHLRDTVQVQEGPLTGKRGVVEHIYENFLFFHDPEHTENHGHLCANARFCVLQNTEVLNAPSANTNGALPRKRHHMLGKEVKIKRGSFKGFRGRVVRAYNKVVHVFVGALLREVTVEQEVVASLEPEVATEGGHSDPNAGPNENPWDASGVQAQDNNGWDDAGANGGGGGWEMETDKGDEKNPVLGNGGAWGDHQNEENLGNKGWGAAAENQTSEDTPKLGGWDASGEGQHNDDNSGKGWGASGDVQNNHEDSGKGWGASKSIENNAENSSKGWGAAGDIRNSEENPGKDWGASGGNQSEDVGGKAWESSGGNRDDESFSKGWGETPASEEQDW